MILNVHAQADTQSPAISVLRTSLRDFALEGVGGGLLCDMDRRMSVDDIGAWESIALPLRSSVTSLQNQALCIIGS